MPLVEITWIDAAVDLDAESGFDTIQKDFGGLVECQNVGYFVRSSAKEVVIAASRSVPDNDYRWSTTIPRSWITRITILEASPNEKAQEVPHTLP